MLKAIVPLAAYAAYAWRTQGSANSGLKAPAYRITPKATVSVAIPAYNEEKYIPALLSSLRNQTYPINEIVVADSSSTGATARIAHKFGARVVRASYGNIASARNQAATASASDILLFTDSDVIFPQNAVERFVGDLRTAACVHPREVIYDSWMWNALLIPGNNWFRENKTSRVAAVWRPAYMAVGGYDEEVIPIKGGREDIVLGERIVSAYGPSALKRSNVVIACSGRRYKAKGVQPVGVNWKPVRAFIR